MAREVASPSDGEGAMTVSDDATIEVTKNGPPVVKGPEQPYPW